LWAVGSSRVPRWRCYLGHVTNPSDLLAHNQGQVETALWSADPVVERPVGDHAGEVTAPIAPRQRVLAAAQRAEHLLRDVRQVVRLELVRSSSTGSELVTRNASANPSPAAR
jgi:hypothetical protein